MKICKNICASLAVALLLVSVAPVASAATLIDDFSGGVTAADSPDPGAFGTWYDITHNTFGTPSASTLDGSPAMQIADGGFTNGVYAIYEGVVPTTGLYTVSADMLVNDTETSQVTAYQLGVMVNGAHRPTGSPSKLPPFTGANDAVGSYSQTLQADVLDSTTTEAVATSTFSANAGDNLLIAFSTDLTSGDFNADAGFWNSATVQVDNIMLNLIPEPSSIALCGLAGMGLALLRRRT